MHFPFATIPATFIERPNRFRVTARLHTTDEIVQVHCPNPGRLGELLLPGAVVHISEALPPSSLKTRKTTHDLRFVEHPQNGQLISLDTRLPNALFAEGVRTGFFEPFRDCAEMRTEVPLPGEHVGVHSRIDFCLLNAEERPCWVEIKSVSLVEDGCALFPDAPTARGRRHVEELAQRVSLGERAAVVFIVQRPDAAELRPQWATDPAFAEALMRANALGVEVYAYTCALSLRKTCLLAAIPVLLVRPDAI